MKTLALAFTVLLTFTLLAEDASKDTLTKVGDTAPVLSIQTVDGQNLDLHSKVTVLNFFATWCGPCMAEMPHLESDLWQPLKDKGLVLVAVGREHSVTEVSKFQKDKKFTFSFAADPKREIYGKFATQYIPRCVLIGKDGKIKFQSTGYSPEEFKTLIKTATAELDK